MADLSLWQVGAVAFFSSFAGGIASPIGKHFYDKFLEKTMHKTTGMLDTKFVTPMREGLIRTVKRK